MDERWHLASLVVRCRPADAHALVAHLDALSGTEVAAHADGRLVVVIEGADEAALVERLEAVRALDGVLAANLVFHHADVDRAGEADAHAP